MPTSGLEKKTVLRRKKFWKRSVLNFQKRTNFYLLENDSSTIHHSRNSFQNPTVKLWTIILATNLVLILNNWQRFIFFVIFQLLLQHNYDSIFYWQHYISPKLFLAFPWFQDAIFFLTNLISLLFQDTKQFLIFYLITLQLLKHWVFTNFLLQYHVLLKILFSSILFDKLYFF